MNAEDKLYWYRGRVVRVIDGDTVVLDIDLGCGVVLEGEHVRLAGIDAPEKVGAEKQLGLEARDFLGCLLSPIGSKVLIRTQKDKRGSFARLLVDIYRGDVHVNEEMVNEGYAVRSKE